MRLFTRLMLFLLIFSIATAIGIDESSGTGSQQMIIITTIFLIIDSPELFGGLGLAPDNIKRYSKPRPHRHRKRRSVMSIFEEMGPNYVRWAYRMEQESFWKLHSLLRPYLEQRDQRQEGSNQKKHRDGAKNGLIPTSVRLSCALRYFAGGSAYDISVVHGISHTEVFLSLWRVVDAVNKCNELGFQYLMA